VKFIKRDEIKRIWSLRWAIATAVLAAIPLSYSLLPYDWTYTIPDWFKATLAYSTLASAVGTAVVRVIQQPPPRSRKNPR
jgi:hypothetical protein